MSIRSALTRIIFWPDSKSFSKSERELLLEHVHRQRLQEKQMIFTQFKQDRKQNTPRNGETVETVETPQVPPVGPVVVPGVSVEYSAHLRELAQVGYLSGASSSGSMLTRVSRAVIGTPEPVWIWLDTDELTVEGQPVPAARVVENIVRERSRKDRPTHVRTVTRSVVGAMNHIIEQATHSARVAVNVGAHDVVPAELVAKYESIRVRAVQVAVRDNKATEEQLFTWASRFEEGGYVGSIEFRAIAPQVGGDYMMVGIGAHAKVLSEWIIVRSERCRNTAPFEGVGVTVDPWSLAGAEVERKMAERWQEGEDNPPAVHTDSFVRAAIVIWDQSREFQDREIEVGMRVAPEVVAAINDVLSFDSQA